MQHIINTKKVWLQIMFTSHGIYKLSYCNAHCEPNKRETTAFIVPYPAITIQFHSIKKSIPNKIPTGNKNY